VLRWYHQVKRPLTFVPSQSVTSLLEAPSGVQPSYVQGAEGAPGEGQSRVHRESIESQSRVHRESIESQSRVNRESIESFESQSGVNSSKALSHFPRIYPYPRRPLRSFGAALGEEWVNVRVSREEFGGFWVMVETPNVNFQ
jgi:hypothetical protein